MELVDDKYCFACGEKNPWGLKLKFIYNEGKVTTAFNLKKEYQGYKDISHGGILATILDEIMAHCLLKDNIMAVTVKMELRFKRPVFTGKDYTAIAKKVDFEGKNVNLEGKIVDSQNNICVLAKAVFRRIE